MAISVNGETVAEERSERVPVIGAGGFGTSLTVESPILPPQRDRIVAGVGGR